jgi:CDGSH-type Zn-finger protein
MATARDHDEVTVTACPDGPLLVRGPASIVGADGEPVPRNRATVALCRCGGTAIPPWCDGTHKINGYRSGPDSSETPVSPRS